MMSGVENLEISTKDQTRSRFYLIVVLNFWCRRCETMLWVGYRRHQLPRVHLWKYLGYSIIVINKLIVLRV